MIRETTLLGSRLAEIPVPVGCSPATLTLRGRAEGRSACFGMSQEQLSRHLLLTGATGTGKTNAILHIIAQLKRGMGPQDVMLVFDAKMDYEQFHASGDCVISNRTGAQSVKWNIFTDIVSDGWDEASVFAGADEIAEVIFSQAISTSSQPFFPSCARDVFSAVLKAMCLLGAQDSSFRSRYLNNRALGEYLTMLDAQRLAAFINQFPSLCGVLKYVGSGQSDQALGIFAELQAVTGRLFVRCFGEDGRFCIRRMQRKREGRTLFIQYDPAYGQALLPMYRIAVDLFLKEALSPGGNGGKAYIICDELKMLPHLAHLEDALNFGRSLGICVIAGIQSMEQLYEVYGEYGGKNIASAFQNTLCFRTNNRASRAYIQDIHGENLTTVRYMDRANRLAEYTRCGHTVEDWDILSLRTGEAIVGLSGEKPFRFYIERYR